MILVVDASAAYDLLTAGRCIERVSHAQELLAPDLIVSELLNARWKVERRREPAPGIADILALLSRLRIMPSLDYAEEAAMLSKRLDHPLYDCIYVALAQHERAKLLTLDERLIAKLRSAQLAKLLCAQPG